MQFTACHVPVNPWADGPGAYVDFQYVDDGAFIEPWLGLRPLQSSPLWEFPLTKCLGAAAVHTIKRRIEGPSETDAVIFGISVSTTRNAFSPPREKLTKRRYF